jgi:hypothetical protein
MHISQCCLSQFEVSQELICRVVDSTFSKLGTLKLVILRADLRLLIVLLRFIAIRTLHSGGISVPVKIVDIAVESVEIILFSVFIPIILKNTSCIIHITISIHILIVKLIKNTLGSTTASSVAKVVL